MQKNLCHGPKIYSRKPFQGIQYSIKGLFDIGTCPKKSGLSVAMQPYKDNQLISVTTADHFNVVKHTLTHTHKQADQVIIMLNTFEDMCVAWYQHGKIFGTTLAGLELESWILSMDQTFRPQSRGLHQ